MPRTLFSIILLLATQTALLAKPIQDEARDVSDAASKSGQPIVKPTNKSGTGMMPMPLVAPLFIQDSNTESDITMVNNSSRALDVEITLTNLSGTQLSKTTVKMAPYAQTVAKISDLLATVPLDLPPPDLPVIFGSVSLMPNRSASLAAQLSIVSRGPYRTSDVEEEFAMMTDPKPAEYRGIVGNISGSPVVAVRSLSSSIQTLSITCIRDKGSSPSSGRLQIAPNQTLLIQACRPSGVTEVKDLSDIFSAQSKNRGGQRYRSPRPQLLWTSLCSVSEFTGKV